MMDATNPAYPPLRDAELIAALDDRVRALEAENARLRALAVAAYAHEVALRLNNYSSDGEPLYMLYGYEARPFFDALAWFTAEETIAAADRGNGHESGEDVAMAREALATLAPPPAGRCIEAEYDYVRAARREAREGRKTNG